MENSTSASAFEYKFSVSHSINRLLELKVLNIFVKHVVLNKVAACGLETGGVLFSEIADINCRPLVKKGLHQGGLPVNILKLSALLQEGLT